MGDHAPPHFHVEYAEHEMQMSIQGRRIMKGSLPPRQARLVTEWAAAREEQLLAAWQQAARDESPGSIDPL